MKDWMVRALKTFIQAFLGVLIPEVVVILQGNLPDSLSGAWSILFPVLCSALAAGISAAWNIVQTKLKKDLEV